MTKAKKGPLRGWERLQVEINVSDPEIASRLDEAGKQFYPPSGHDLHKGFRPRRSPVKIYLPDGLLAIAAVLAEEKGTTPNKILSRLVSEELVTAFRALRQELNQSRAEAIRSRFDDDIPF